MNALTLVDELFNEVFPQLQTKNHYSWGPRVDIYEDGERFILNADVPGLTENDFKMEFNDGILTLAGEKKEEKRNYTAYKRERIFGKFERSFNFGSSINEEEIKAKLANGILEITLPKKEVKKARQIHVS